MYKSSLIGLLRNKNYDLISIIGLIKMIIEMDLFLSMHLKG